MSNVINFAERRTNKDWEDIASKIDEVMKEAGATNADSANFKEHFKPIYEISAMRNLDFNLTGVIIDGEKYIKVSDVKEVVRQIGKERNRLTFDLLELELSRWFT